MSKQMSHQHQNMWQIMGAQTPPYFMRPVPEYLCPRFVKYEARSPRKLGSVIECSTLAA